MVRSDRSPRDRLLDWLLSGDEAAAGDLDELYRDDRRRFGRLKAALWFVARLLPMMIARRHRDPLADVPGRSGDTWYRTVLRDVRYAWRGLLRPTGISAALTLGAGIAVVTVVFGLVWQSVLRPIPFPNPERLDWIGSRGDLAVSQRQYELLRPELAAITDITGIGERGYSLSGTGEAVEVRGLTVTANHFVVFGVAPFLGRTILEEDARLGAEPVVYLAHELWVNRYGADSSIIGRRIDLYASVAIPMLPGAYTGKRHTVVGILPPSYRPFGHSPQVLTVLVPDPSDDSFSQLRELNVIGRRRAGAAANDTRRVLQAAVNRMPELADLRDAVAGNSVTSLQDALVGAQRPSMLAALSASLLILLIAGTNVVTLLLVRLRTRDRELSIRRALGATRGRMMAQFLTEGALIAIAGTLIGLSLAFVLKQTLAAVLPVDIRVNIRLTGAPLAMALASMCCVAVACGVLPSIGLDRATTAGLAARSTVGVGRRGSRLLQALIAIEIALAVVVTYAAFGVGFSLARINQADLGFSPEHVETLRIAPAAASYRDPDVRRAVVEGALDQARALPGVTAAGAIHFLPIADGGPSIGFRSELSTDTESRAANYRIITPGYLEAMRIPIRAGRAILSTDGAGASRVGVVNESLAKALWPDGSPVGRSLYRASGELFFTVVGVVADVRQRAVASSPEPEIYLPLAQTAWASAMSLVVRTTGDAESLGGPLRSIVRTLDPTMPITRVAPMSELVRESVANDRLLATVFGTFAVLSLALGAIGVFAVAAAAVSARRREIGVRLAVGATRSQIARHELIRSGRLVAAGLVMGLAATLMVSRVIRGLLYNVAPLDPVLLACVVVVQISVVGLAIALPTWRASRVDPNLTLRLDA